MKRTHHQTLSTRKILLKYNDYKSIILLAAKGLFFKLTFALKEKCKDFEKVWRPFMVFLKKSPMEDASI